MDDTYDHPTLGPLYPEDTDWQIDDVRVPFVNAPIRVCLADGTDDGPSADALAGYDWIAHNWNQVLKLIGDEAFEFYEPYADAVPGVPRFESPTELWGTELVLSVRIFSQDEFEITLRFKWQQEEDPHIVTFEIEGGACICHCVDG